MHQQITRRLAIESSFFYAPIGDAEPGFYGWAIVLDMHDDERGMYFRPVHPSDHLKMHPWWDATAKAIADQVRGGAQPGSLWRVPNTLVADISNGIRTWIGGSAGNSEIVG